MECVEVQGLITKYINGELQGVQLEDFLEHIDGCADCKEELEIYYVIMTGMKQMEDDHVPNYDFHTSFERKLEESKKLIVHNNKQYIVKLIIFEILILIIGFMLTRDSANLKDAQSNVNDIDTFNGIVIE